MLNHLSTHPQLDPPAGPIGQGPDLAAEVDAASIAHLAPRLFAELVRRFAAGRPFETAAGAFAGEEYLTQHGAVMASLLIVRKEIYLHLFTKIVDYGRLHLATRLSAGQYDLHFDEASFDAFIDRFAEQPITPQSPAELIAAELKHKYGDMGGRIDKALALYQQGVVEFPQYHTHGDDAQCPPRRECDCPDARHRAPRLEGIGSACKHGLAQHIAWLVEMQEDQVAYRKLIDKVERRRGEQQGSGGVGEQGSRGAGEQGSKDRYLTDLGYTDAQLAAPPTTEYQRMLDQELRRRRAEAMPAQLVSRKRIGDYL